MSEKMKYISMSQRKQDPLLQEIEWNLCPGESINYRDSDNFIEDLELVKKKIDDLVKKGEAKRAVKLYEVFLSGCEEKMNEMNDEGIEMGMFFQELFIAWVKARQTAQCDCKETVDQILCLMDKDDFGLCNDIEKEIAQHIKGAEFELFVEQINARFEKTLTIGDNKDPKPIHDNSWSNANILKAIALVKRNVRMYCAVCEKVGFSSKDYEAIAGIYMTRSRWEEALQYVESGLKLQKSDASAYNDSGYQLESMKRTLLQKTKREDEALQLAWESFKRYPSDYGYKELMKYVPEIQKSQWHERALDLAQKGDLSNFIDLCLETKEITRLAPEIMRATPEILENIFYGRLQDAGDQLFVNYPQAAIKIYRALGINILNMKKSKCYDYAIEYFKKVRDLYGQLGLEDEWLALVKEIKAVHSQKSAFMPNFNVLISGGDPKEQNSFASRVQGRWKEKFG